MIAATGTYTKPLTLQSPTGTYGTIPAPKVGSTPTMAAPQWISTSAPRPVLRAPAPTTQGMPLPAPQSPATAQTATAAPSGAPPVNRMAPPAGVNPSLAGTSTLMPPPPNINPIPQGGQQFQPAGGTVPPGTTAVSGSEVPYHVGTGPGQATTDVLSKLATEAGRQLDQPTVWDDPLAQQIKAQRSAGVDENYRKAGASLDASLADRGINYSTIAGGDIMDLNKAHAADLGAIDTDIAQQRANALAAGRQSAFQNASGFVGTNEGVNQTTRANQVGERGYADTLRRQAQTDAAAGDQNFQSLLDRVYGMGTGSQGAAAGIYGGQGAVNYESAGQDQAGLADLAQLAAQYFGRAA